MIVYVYTSYQETLHDFSMYNQYINVLLSFIPKYILLKSVFIIFNNIVNNVILENDLSYLSM